MDVFASENIIQVKAMIIYFSATGNTKHVADMIMEDGEEIVSVEAAMKNGSLDYKVDDERVGFLTPTYDFTIPSIVREFIEKMNLDISGNPYIFYVGTFGTTTGGASSVIEKLLASKGIRLDAKFDIRMPDTWTVMFDLSDKNRVKRQNDRADAEIVELKEQLSKRISGKYMDFTLPLFAGNIGGKIYDGNTRKTRHLSVNDSCIGCGLCERKCPVQAIKMVEKKPVWVKDKCTMCLGCLHRCPKYAIRYDDGKKTDKHGQYKHPTYGRQLDY